MNTKPDVIRGLPPLDQLPETVQANAEQWHDLNRRITETSQLAAELAERHTETEAADADAAGQAAVGGAPLPDPGAPAVAAELAATRRLLDALTAARTDHDTTLRTDLKTHLPDLAETARTAVNQAAADYRRAIDKARAMLEIPAAKLAEATSLAQFVADVSREADPLTVKTVPAERANFGPAIAAIAAAERLAEQATVRDRDSLFAIRGSNGVVTRVRAWIAWDMLSSLNEPDIELMNQSDLLAIREAVGVDPAVPNPPTAEQKRARLAVGLKRPRRIR